MYVYFLNFSYCKSLSRSSLVSGFYHPLEIREREKEFELMYIIIIHTGRTTFRNGRGLISLDGLVVVDYRMGLW